MRSQPFRFSGTGVGHAARAGPGHQRIPHLASHSDQNHPAASSLKHHPGWCLIRKQDITGTIRGRRPMAHFVRDATMLMGMLFG